MPLQVRGGGGAALSPALAGAGPGAPLLEACGLAKRWAGRWALRGVSLSVGPGQRLVVAGPNGAGKTTLLRVLAGLARPDYGWLRLFDLPWDGRNPRLRRAVSYLGHEPPLLPDLTARENLAWVAGVYGLSAGWADAALARAGLARLAGMPVRALSRGQRQRLALARAFLPGVRLLLLDEPWTGLDADGRALLEAWLQEHEARGGAAVLTAHDPPAAGAVLRLEGGRPVA